MLGPTAAPGLRHTLLGQLRDQGPRSRAELADGAGMTRSRVLIEIDELISTNFVREAGPALSRGGRRSTLIELHPRIRFAAVDVGVSSIDVEVTDGMLQPLARFSEPADVRQGPRKTLHRVNDILAKLKTDGAFDQLTSIGIGLPGPVSFRDGVPVSPPIMPGWDRFPVRDALAREHGCSVVVDNDVNIMALGEQHGGVAHSVDDYLFVKLGSGIGCGIFLNGQVYRGTDGCAGDIGHMRVEDNGPVCSCGNTGCLESMAGGNAFARDAAALARSGKSLYLSDRLAQGGLLTAKEVGDGAADGDTACLALVRAGARRVGSVLASLVSFVNPSMIVIGGGLAGLGHVLLAEIRSVVYRRSLPLASGNMPIVMSELGARAGVVGAALLASELSFGAEEQE